MSWLSDASANRHIKTYVKDFLDISGSLMVRNGNVDISGGTLNDISVGAGSGANSVAIGISPVASAANSIAIGSSANATGSFDTAIGRHANATGGLATGIGPNANATGSQSLALGYGPEATGACSIAIGRSANASGEYGIAMGYTAFSNPQSLSIGSYANVSANRATAVGAWAPSASGYYATALGSTCAAVGQFSIAMGVEANAADSFAIAIGRVTKASYANCVAIGYYANTFGNAYGTAVGPQTRANTQSTALGWYANANGYISTALGRSAAATGANSIAIGYSAYASNIMTTAVGYVAKAANAYDTAIGSSSNAYGGQAACLGFATAAGGYRSVAIGAYANTTQDNAIILGTTTQSVGIGSASPISRLDVNGATFVNNQTVSFATGGGAGTVSEEVALVFNAGSDNRSLALKTDSNANLYGTYGGGSSRPVAWMLGTSNDTYIAGYVGIGTTSPSRTLHVYGSDVDAYLQLSTTNSGSGSQDGFHLQCVNSSKDANLVQREAANMKFYTSNTERMRINSSGYVGIGTTNPSKASVHVHSSVTTYIGARFYNVGGANGYLTMNRLLSIYTEEQIACEEIQVFSDRRIKKNIVDVPDDLALQMVRDIPCRYYEYVDTATKGTERTVGFIAQEVKEVLPMAVSVSPGIIPDEYRELENFTWEETDDNKYKLYCDLQDCSGVTYRFMAKNNLSEDEDEDESKVETFEIVGNEDNSFTFEKKYDSIFCYGKEVDDFHRIDKQKIFAIAFSATQELDRLLQAEKAKVATLESQMADVLARLSALESP